jgi:citronellol/citronellal dehydrogenase
VSLAGKRIFITGGSRGIGLAIALRAAQDGAKVAIAAKTTEPHPTLPGTIYSAVEEINAAGGEGLALQCDIRDETQIEAAIAKTVETFGGIDILINKASAINLTPTLATPAKRFDLMFDVNVRGTFLTSQAALPHLKKSAAEGRNPHILTLSPPLSMKAKWFKPHLAYTMSKYGMSMCVLGLAEEFKRDGIGVNALWPRTAVDTAALAMIPGVDTGVSFKEVSSCMAADRPGLLSSYAPAGAGGLPGMGGGGRRRRGTRGKGKGKGSRRQRGGRYSFDLTASPTVGGTPWGNGIPQVMSIPCESARHNPLNLQAGGVGGVDSAYYVAPTAGYTNNPSSWVGAAGAPVQIQTPYDAGTMNPACLKTGGGRKRRGSYRKGSRRKGKRGSRRR